MAMGIILKDKKDIEWKGLPCASLSDMQSLKVIYHLCILYPLFFCRIGMLLQLEKSGWNDRRMHSVQ